MARPPTIHVMVSSRCSDPIDFHGDAKATLTAVRLELKKSLEEENLLGSQLYEVWINEDSPPAEGSSDSWEACLQQVRKADIVLVLYNGNAGWAKDGGEVGICFGEMEAALSISPAKVRLIELPIQPLGTGTTKSRNQRFRDFVSARNLFRGAACQTGEEVIGRCKAALRQATAEMVQLGGREARKGKYDKGSALDWSRLTFEDRRKAMEEALRDSLLERASSEQFQGQLFVSVSGRSILALPHGIPAAMTVAAAREMVGQPFLRDYEVAGVLRDKRVGPIHFIACHRGITEPQAARQLGFPDATIVSPPFGVYVADNIQKIQLIFMANCRDETTTRVGVQRVFEWLEQSGEG
jgi:hypothetical protein